MLYNSKSSEAQPFFTWPLLGHLFEASRGHLRGFMLKLVGHSTREVHAHYTHHELAPLRGAIARIPAVGV
jgi:hypothetical protein